MFVDPGVLNGTPAITMIRSFPEAKSNNLAAFTAFITALLNRSTGVVTAQCNPQNKVKRDIAHENLKSSKLLTISLAIVVLRSSKHNECIEFSEKKRFEEKKTSAQIRSGIQHCKVDTLEPPSEVTKQRVGKIHALKFEQPPLTGVTGGNVIYTP